MTKKQPRDYSVKVKCNETTTRGEIREFLDRHQGADVLIQYDNHSHIDEDNDTIELKNSIENLPKFNDIINHCKINLIYILK